MTKLEKYWRKQSGIKSTSIKKSSNKKKKSSIDNSSASANNNALEKGKDLKKYLQKNQCFDKDLLMVCVGMGMFFLDLNNQTIYFTFFHLYSYIYICI